MSDPFAYPLSLSEVKDAVAVIAAIEQAIEPFVTREGGISFAPVLHALAVFLAAQAVAADEPIEGLLFNVKALYTECLAKHQSAHPKGLFRG